jgi:4-amino-4-deoxy-L-arabinose transferase-like glycosyltransferase
MNKRTLLLLGGIVLLAGLLRFYKLATIPPSLEWDEVATGYDAYSILKTGHDQYGTLLPITLRSLDDYKPPVYTYLTVVSIALLGWNDFAVRAPAALLGVLAVISTYALVYLLFKQRSVALLSAFFLAISPWHVNFSRLALETNSTIFVTTFAVWAFLKGLQKGKWLVLSAFLFGIDLYLYHNARVFVPLLGLALVLLNYQELKRQIRYVFFAGCILAVFVVRLIPIVTSVEGQMRFQGTSIFTQAESIETAERKQEYTNWKLDDQASGQGFIGKLVHSQKVFYALTIFKNYLSHFDPTFWIFTNDQPRHHVPELGILYLVDLPFVYLGLYFMFHQKHKKSALLILSWFLFAPVAASVTRDVPHALRSELMLPTFQIMISFGILGMLRMLTRKPRLRVLVTTVVVGAYLINSGLFFHLYFVHFAKDTSKYWVYGRREAALYAESQKNRFDRIIVSTALDQPHMFFLYYLKYDPVRYLKEGGTASGGWAENRNHFDKYYFQPLGYPEKSDGKTLFVGLPSEFPKGIEALKKIKYLSGEDAIWIVQG